jgi:GR25 family glycosyltransferase involved in LPS biosynthesis
VFEDDFLLPDNFIHVLKEFWQYVPNDFGIVFLGWCGGPRPLVSDPHVIAKRAMCTHAYVITRDAARKLVSSLPPVLLPIDIEIEQAEKKGIYIPMYALNGFKHRLVFSDGKPRKDRDHGIVCQNEELGSSIHGALLTT